MTESPTRWGLGTIRAGGNLPGSCVDCLPRGCYTLSANVIRWAYGARPFFDGDVAGIREEDIWER